AKIQTSILPKEKQLAIKNLEIAASMDPATEVGGDYYDFLPIEAEPGSCFIAIGDVAGHGLNAGLVMMMIQSIVSALVRSVGPEPSPRDMLQVLNAVMYENIRERLLQDEHATLSLLRYTPNGEIVWAGAHEDLLFCRAADGVCERIPTPGTWLGAMED